MKRLLAPTLVLCLVATGASCGSDDERSDRPVPTTTSPATTEPEPTDEEQLEELAQGWFEASRMIFSGTEDVGAADEFLAGPYLRDFQVAVADLNSAGRTIQLDEKSDHEVESVEIESDSTAAVTECVIDADVLIESSTGELLNDDVIAKRYRSVAEQTPNGWRYSTREIESETAGATRCESA